ncbi:hypothetical protein MNBD_ALPHA08-2121 [hydrothermal vent metagenome]|uniref:Major facilitator superfamily (MFS) profile domain-containing protein n=1 Tax=hydrothermal vent metagenome TaxID=652676 RepID=A0A3B0QYC4_9ZZZZ
MTVGWQKLLPGFAATLMGIGLARFSFTPVSALMVEKQLLTSQDITTIAAFMMAAYAFGAFSANALAKKFGAVSVVRWCFVIITIGLLSEGIFATFSPVFVGRFVMSLAGAMLMVLGPGMILSSLPPQRQGFAAGFIFTGVGFGILMAGALVAVVAASPILTTATALFIFALAVTVLGWRQWPEQQPVTEGTDGQGGVVFTFGFIGLLVAYALDAVAYIPHTVYLSDFTASELGFGAKTGGIMWAIFGIGGIIGAASAAWLRQKFGGQLSLELAIGTKALFIGLLGFATTLPVVAISAFVVGALVPGFVMLVATRTVDLVGPQNLTAAWGIMTGVFAIGQFVGATGMSIGYLSLTKYQPLFAVGGMFEALGLLALIVFIRFLTPQKKGTPP